MPGGRKKKVEVEEEKQAVEETEVKETEEQPEEVEGEKSVNPESNEVTEKVGESGKIPNDEDVYGDGLPEEDVVFDEEEEEEEEDEEDVQITLGVGGQGVGNVETIKPLAAGGARSLMTIDMSSKGGVQRGAASKSKGPYMERPAGQGSTAFELDIDGMAEKPWRKPGADITDYFNYGFNEDTWRAYCYRQLQVRVDNKMQGKIKTYESREDGNEVPQPPQGLPQGMPPPGAMGPMGGLPPAMMAMLAMQQQQRQQQQQQMPPHPTEPASSQPIEQGDSGGQKIQVHETRSNSPGPGPMPQLPPGFPPMMRLPPGMAGRGFPPMGPGGPIVPPGQFFNMMGMGRGGPGQPPMPGQPMGQPPMPPMGQNPAGQPSQPSPANGQAPPPPEGQMNRGQPESNKETIPNRTGADDEERHRRSERSDYDRRDSGRYRESRDRDDRDRRDRSDYYSSKRRRRDK